MPLWGNRSQREARLTRYANKYPQSRFEAANRLRKAWLMAYTPVRASIDFDHETLFKTFTFQMPMNCSVDSDVAMFHNALVEAYDSVSRGTLGNFAERRCLAIPKRIIRNGPALIVFWNDGTKTVVKCHNEEFDYEKGLAMALARKLWNRSQTIKYVKSIEEQEG